VELNSLAAVMSILATMVASGRMAGEPYSGLPFISSMGLHIVMKVL